jgi:uncharacterized membrane protein YhhN
MSTIFQTMTKPAIFWIGYALLAGLNLFAEYQQQQALIYATKPLLMPLLAFFFWTNIRQEVTPVARLLLIALFFAWGGDVLLLSPNLFLFGLISFLITQSLYLITFSKISGKRGLLFQQPIWLLPFILIFAGNMVLLWSGIPTPLKIPVIIYSLAIIGMVMAAFNLYPIIPRSLFYTLISGVLLFLISDNLIALGKFSDYQVPYNRVWIMSTYILGQSLIVGAGLGLYRQRPA